MSLFAADMKSLNEVENFLITLADNLAKVVSEEIVSGQRIGKSGSPVLRVSVKRRAFSSRTRRKRSGA